MVTYADMDNLKYVNDIYGHDEGDYAIKGIGHILKAAFAGDTVMSVGICQRKYSSDIDLYDMISMADERLYMDKRRRKNERGTYYNIPCAK